MAKKGMRSLKNRFINFITFADRPIKKKFLLFSIGVLFWFVAMFVVSATTLLDIHFKVSRIINDLVPQERIAQKIIKNFQSLSADASDIAAVPDMSVLMQKSGAARMRFEQNRTLLATLKSGGRVNDYARDTNRLLESFAVAPVRDAEGERFIVSLTNLSADAAKEFDALAALKTETLKNRPADRERLEAKLAEFKNLVASAVSQANEHSLRVARSYHSNSEAIQSDIVCTFSTVTGVLLIASVLLIVFTIWISDSITKPVNAIIGQVRSLGEQETVVPQKIEITSNDEIGVLSQEFNGLMETIHDLATFKKVIEEDENLEDVYSRLGKVFAHSVAHEDFIIYEIGSSQNKMRPVYPVTPAESEILCNPDILDNCFLCRAKKTGHKVSSFMYPDMCRQFVPVQERDYVCIPLIVGGVTGGVVQFTFMKSETKGLPPEELDRKIFKAEQYIKESVSVIEAKRLMNTLKDSALKDSLTGLYNRRFLQEYTENLVSGALRRGKNIGLIMCDLDYFKQINDVYGHNTGDSVLKEIGRIIKDSVRASDLVIRFGGEEFLVVLIDVADGYTLKIAEKIRESVENTKMKVPDGIIKKTISLGVSEFPGDTDSFWQAIKFSDVALYAAKEAGRNKALKFTADMWKEEQF